MDQRRVCVCVCMRGGWVCMCHLLEGVLASSVKWIVFSLHWFNTAARLEALPVPKLAASLWTNRLFNGSTLMTLFWIHPGETYAKNSQRTEDKITISCLILWLHISLRLQKSLMCHSESARWLTLAMLVAELKYCQCTAEISHQLLHLLPWIFIQTFMVPRGWILLTLGDLLTFSIVPQ